MPLDDPNQNTRVTLQTTSGDPAEIEVSLLTAPLPNRDFRDAWRLSGTVISVDMAAARQIAIDEIKRFRKSLFEGRPAIAPSARDPGQTEIQALDARWMRAMARRDTAVADAIEAKREQLRNVTTDARLTSATTPEALKVAKDSIISEITAVATS